MKRPWHIALLFGASLVLLLAATGWMSVTLLHLHRAEAAARREAQLEENVRLALWRMDAALGPLIAAERARPYFLYRAFYPAEAAFGASSQRAAPVSLLVPSPLLAPDSPYVLLYFELPPDGAISSPQVPPPAYASLAVPDYTSAERIAAAAERMAALGPALAPDRLLAGLPAPPPPGAPPIPAPDGWGPGEDVAAQADTSATQHPAQGQRRRPGAPAPVKGRSQAEYEQRAGNVAQQQMSRQILNTMREADTPVASEGLLVPHWAGERLLLLRRVRVGAVERIQGCWLDWPALRTWLTGLTGDLLADARLEPVADPAVEPKARLLGGLPARLVATAAVGPVATAAAPVWPPLVLAWACVLLAAGAVAALLIGAVTLSERRAAFVSAVTHELRTPLTTFRLYTEMLADGLVRDETQRRQYLATLQSEALRLAHLVENVLAYARLERRGRTAAPERVSVAQLVERSGARLAERAGRAGMCLCIEAGGAEDAVLRGDAGAVEQILLNLVDNACKYAGRAADRRIHLVIAVVPSTARPRTIQLRVGDHGPGIARAEARRLFKPFQKSAADAADSAPGVGLGLALSRRLARAMGGDLRRAPATGGAWFELTLPVG